MTDDLERRLRRALHDDASSLIPSDRRRSIEAIVREDAATPSGRRRWSAPVASAAAVAVIAALAWGATEALRPPGDRAATTAATTGVPDVAAGPTPSLTGPEPSASVVAGPAPSASPTPAATGWFTSAPSPTATSAPSATASPAPSAPASSGLRGAGTAAVLPVYLVGSVGGDGTGQRYGLFRELVRRALPPAATPAQQAQAALTAAMGVMAATPGDPGTSYPRPWSGTTVSGVTVADGAITVGLSDAGPTGLPAEQSRLAVQELVWTATAAVGQASLPVRFSVPGATTLLGSYPTSAAYSRPAADATYQDLAPIWVESPAAGADLPADRPVVVSGSASVFEATLQWRLTRSGAEVAKGVSTASIGAPARGTWTADLGRLPAGTYSFTASEISAEDGSVHAEDGTTFTVG